MAVGHLSAVAVFEVARGLVQPGVDDLPKTITKGPVNECRAECVCVASLGFLVWARPSEGGRSKTCFTREAQNENENGTCKPSGLKPSHRQRSSTCNASKCTAVCSWGMGRGGVLVVGDDVPVIKNDHLYDLSRTVETDIGQRRPRHSCALDVRSSGGVEGALDSKIDEGDGGNRAIRSARW